jgi:hypothetical protein
MRNCLNWKYCTIQNANTALKKSFSLDYLCSPQTFSQGIKMWQQLGKVSLNLYSPERVRSGTEFHSTRNTAICLQGQFQVLLWKGSICFPDPSHSPLPVAEGLTTYNTRTLPQVTSKEVAWMWEEGMETSKEEPEKPTFFPLWEHYMETPLQVSEEIN